MVQYQKQMTTVITLTRMNKHILFAKTDLVYTVNCIHVRAELSQRYRLLKSLQRPATSGPCIQERQPIPRGTDSSAHTWTPGGPLSLASSSWGDAAQRSTHSETRTCSSARWPPPRTDEAVVHGWTLSCRTSYDTFL